MKGIVVPTVMAFGEAGFGERDVCWGGLWGLWGFRVSGLGVCGFEVPAFRGQLAVFSQLAELQGQVAVLFVRAGGARLS